MRDRLPTDNVRTIAVAFGAAYLAAGVLGFLVTGFDDFARNTDEALLGFDVNPFHNIVHIGVGVLWLLAARLPRREAVEGVHIGIGGVLLLATVLGMIGALEALSIDGPLAADNLLHLISGIAAVAVGLSATRASQRAAPAG